MVWRNLELSSSAGDYLPPLLLSAAFDQDTRSYTVHLTDLTYIWSESLSRHEIIRRSQEEGTSIDPSNEDQLEILLEKIKLGLERGKETSSTLTVNIEDDRPAITLHLTVQLPGGLAPLEWPIQLSPAPQSLLTIQLTIPLLVAQQARIQELESLAEVLREKDHVIQKLLDKLESQGTDLAQVFPQAARKKQGRRLDRTGAEERVKGLKAFDLEAWRQSLDTNESHDTGQLVSHVFSGDATSALWVKAEEAQNGSMEDWWGSIKGITVSLDSGRITTHFLQSRPRSVASRQNNLGGASKAKQSPKKYSKKQSGDTPEEDGDFQAQLTPPHLRSKRKSASPKAIISETTDSENDDLDGPSQRSKVTDSFPVSQQLGRPTPTPLLPAKSKKLGKIGGKRLPPEPIADENTTTDKDNFPSQKASKNDGLADGKKAEPEENISTEDEPLLPRHPSKNPDAREIANGASKLKRPSVIEDDASTEDEISPQDPSPSHPSRSPEDLTKPAKGVLGKIGGKKRPPSPDASPPPPASEEESAPTPVAPAKSKKGKLGQIGGKKKETDKGDTSAPATTTEVNEPALEKSPHKTKLGVIGKRKERKATSPIITDAPKEEAEQRGRKDVKEEKQKTPEPRETSQERADRKRAQLKRELEEKAKAPATKKKRKF